MDIVFTIFFVLCLIIFSALIVDYIVFKSKIKLLQDGMTGIMVQKVTKLTLHITSVDKDANIYYARVTSRFTVFSYVLVFRNGKLKDWY